MSIEAKQTEEITHIELDELTELLNNSTYEQKIRDKLLVVIEGINNIEEYENIKTDLINNRLGIDGMVNPSQRDINRHIKKIAQPI